VTIERDRIGDRERLKLLRLDRFPGTLHAILVLLRLGRIDDENAGGAIEDHVLAAIQPLRRIAKSDDGGQSQRPGENRDVRSPRARVGCNSDYRLAVELHREAGSEIVGH